MYRECGAWSGMKSRTSIANTFLPRHSEKAETQKFSLPFWLSRHVTETESLEHVASRKITEPTAHDKAVAWQHDDVYTWCWAVNVRAILWLDKEGRKLFGGFPRESVDRLVFPEAEFSSMHYSHPYMSSLNLISLEKCCPERRFFIEDYKWRCSLPYQQPEYKDTKDNLS